MEGGPPDQRDLIYMRRRFQELFRGRFSEDEADRLLEHFRFDVMAAADFVLTEENQRRVREISGSDDRWIPVISHREIRKQIRHNIIIKEIRQFGCLECDNMWWRKVPGRKMVSRCYKCRIRFDAIPRDKEWGLAEFSCPNCGNTFRGLGQMGNTYCPCYECNALCIPLRIIPPYPFSPQRSQRSRRHHSCRAHNCYHRAPGEPIPGICVHPLSLARKAVSPSNRHNSTGSTVDTFLTQDDTRSEAYSFTPSLNHIDEGEENSPSEGNGD